MRKSLKTAAAAAALVGSVLTAAAPAMARPYGWHGYHHGYRYGHGGGALAAGVVGLAVGAAIANGGGYHSRGYYGRPAGYGYYGPPRGYYYPGPVCWTRWQWDPYYGDRVPVEICR